MKQKNQRSLIVKDMILRGAHNGGKMRDRRLRRPKDAKNNNYEDDSYECDLETIENQVENDMSVLSEFIGKRNQLESIHLELSELEQSSKITWENKYNLVSKVHKEKVEPILDEMNLTMKYGNDLVFDFRSNVKEYLAALKKSIDES